MAARGDGRIDLGVVLPSMAFLDGREPLVSVARIAEELGFDSLWVPDHVVFPVDRGTAYPYSDRGMQAARPMPAYDPFVSLGVAAGCTERIGLGTAVIVLPLRNPIVTAKQLATIDVLSDGRLSVGVGSGWLEEEFAVVNAPPYADRGAVTDEWVAIFRTCWSEALPSYAGRHYAFPAVHFAPQPARLPPILVGGNAAPAMRRAGRIGDGWIGTAVPPDGVRETVRRVRDHARDAGRDPDALVFRCGYTLDIGGEAPEPHLVGSPEEVAAKVRALHAAGLDGIELRLAATRDPENASLARGLEQLERFATEVRPLLA